MTEYETDLRLDALMQVNIENGDIPFYGTALANYNSMNVALNCGFSPAWVEIGAVKK